MPYTVQFVGLVCFYRERGGRLALLPDGRNPDNGIPPHYGEIVVDPTSVQGSKGWDNIPGAGEGRFPLDGCNVVIEGADVAGTLDTTEHKLPQLRDADSKFEIDPARAQTVAKLQIRQGTLKSRRVPGGDALISQLDVPHDGTIEIKVKPDNGSAAERSITLAPGTEIAVSNMAGGGIYLNANGQKREVERKKREVASGSSDGLGHHFKIYEKLSVNRVDLRDPATVPAVEESTSKHLLFQEAGPINLYTDCSNTGCC